MVIVKNGLIVGIANLLVSLALMTIYSFAIPGYSNEINTGAAFRSIRDPLMLLFFLSPLVAGLAYAYFWSLFGKNVKGKQPKDKALEFTKFYFLFATIPGMFITYTTFRVSLMLILAWAIQGVISAYVAGWLLARQK